MTSGGSSFNDFAENQLIIDFAFLCKPTSGNATVPPSPDIISGNGILPQNIWGNGVPQKIFGGTAFPRVLPQLHHCF